MRTVLSITFIIILLVLTVFQLFRNHRAAGYVGVKSTVIPRVLTSLLIMLLCGSSCGWHDSFRLLFDAIVSVVSLVPFVLSVHPAGRLPFYVGQIPAIIPATAVCHLLCFAGVLEMPSHNFFMALSGFTAVCFSGLFIWMIWRRLRDVKSVMKAGNVWSYVTLCVDFVYVTAPLMIVSVLSSIFLFFPHMPDLPVLIAVVFLLLEVVAIVARVSGSSAFVLLHDHERLIVESMKISHMDVSSTSDPRGEEQYKELYERIVLYFEMSKPYLDGDLTINDVVKVVYSNKVYISKAICHYTGRNFRQFVNYYRVIYSMNKFRDNPEMKVSELAELSGFNTVVSYTMAFRLFMNETPSEWCRKERSKILKTKK